jgi:cytochrome b6-f complex subunit 4
MPEHEGDTVPFYPDHLRAEAKVVGGVLLIALIFGLAGIFYPVGLGLPADPLDTPAHVKPEWYFLALYQLLKYISKTAGVVLPIVALLLVLALPFLARRPDQTERGTRRRAIIAGAIVFVFIALTIWGEVG